MKLVDYFLIDNCLLSNWLHVIISDEPTNEQHTKQDGGNEWTNED